MTIFVTFSLFAAFIYVIAVVMRPRGGTTNMAVQFSDAFQTHLRRFIPDPELLWLLTLLLSLLLILIPIWWFFFQNFRNPAGPDITYGEFLTSASVSKAMFGALFGLLFAYWFRGVVLTEAKDGPSYKEIIVAVVMIILLILGIGGQTVLASLFDRLTGFEVGGTKLAFTESHQSSQAGTVTTAQKNPQRFGAPDTSQGLGLLAGIADTIGKDADYIEIISGKRPDWEENAVAFAKAVVSPPTQCLSDYVRESGDSSRVGDLLTGFAAQIGSGMRLDDTKAITASISSMAKTVQDFFNPSAQLRSCASIGEFDKSVNERLKTWADGDKWKERPYLWLAAASMFASGHHYPPAIALLDQWIRALTVLDSTGHIRLPSSEASRIVDEIRVRNAAVLFVEEWIRYSPTSKTVAVLDYHLSNLDGLLGALNKVPALVEALGKINSPDIKLKDSGFLIAPDDHGQCPLFHYQPGQGKQGDLPKLGRLDLGIVRLIETVISTKALWITAALDNPEFVSRYSSKAHAYINELMSLNLSCSRLLSDPDQGDDPDELPSIDRSEMLNLYARITLAESSDLRTRQISDTDKMKANLREARQAVELGVQIISVYKDASTAELRNKRFLDQIAGDSAVSAYEDLVTDRINLDDAMSH